MPRVPVSSDVQLTQLRPAAAPQIDIGVAANIGKAGRAWGNAIEALGAGFSELAGRYQAADDATNASSAKLAYMQGADDEWRKTAAEAGTDGEAWGQYPGRLGTLQGSIDERYPISDPKKRREFQMWRDEYTWRQGRRALDEQQGLRYKSFLGNFEQNVDGVTKRIEAGDISPEQFQEYASGLYGQLDAQGPSEKYPYGVSMTQAQIEAKKAEINARLTGAILGRVGQDKPEEVQKFWGDVRQGHYELEDIKQGQQPAGAAKPGTELQHPQGGAYGLGRQGQLQFEGAPIERSVGRERGSKISGFVVHETQGSDTAEGNLSWSNKTNTGANYYIDKSGRVIQWAPDNVAMNHAGKGRGGDNDARPEFSNDNTLSVEIMTREGERPNAAQIAAARQLIAAKSQEYGFKASDVYGHGELAPGHREASEGMDVVNLVRGQGLGSAEQQGGAKVTATATAYSPTKGASDTAGSGGEGSYAAAKPGPDGKSEVRTLADVAAGRSKYVTLAGDASQNGKTYIIPEITFRDASGKEQTLKNIPAVVHDTGSSFQGKGDGRVDIPADKDLPDGGASQPYSGKQVTLIPSDEKLAPTPVGQRGIGQIMHAAQERSDGGQQQDQQPTGRSLGEYLRDRLKEARAEPDRPLSEVLPPEAIEELKPFIGPNVHADKVTVGDALGALDAMRNKDGRVDVADASDAIPQSIRERMATADPNANLRDVVGDLPEAQRLRSAFPDLFDDETATVKDAREFAETMGIDLGDSAKPSVFSQDIMRPGYKGKLSDEFPMGRLQPGQSWNVGGFKITSDMLNGIDARQRKALDAAARDRMKIIQRQREVVATEMMRNAESSMEQNGQPPEGYDAAGIKAVMRMNPREVAKHEARMRVAQSLYSTFNQSADMSIDEIAEKVDGLYPKAGSPHEAEEMAGYDKAVKKLADLEGLRTPGTRHFDPVESVDPSQAVQRRLSVKPSSMVDDARRAMQSGKPSNRSEALALIEARLSAQSLAGIDEASRQPLTMAEARRMAGPLRGMDAGTAYDNLPKIEQDVRSKFGDRYAGVITRQIIDVALRDKKERQTFDQTLDALAEEGKVGPTSLAGVREKERLDSQQPVAKPVPPPQRSMWQKIGDYVPSLPGPEVGKNIDVELYPPMAAKRSTPPAAAIDALVFKDKADPYQVEKFRRTFGLQKGEVDAMIRKRLQPQ